MDCVDQINLRRLLSNIRKNINTIFRRHFFFELNDNHMRNLCIKTISNFLSSINSEFICNYNVVCDESNNNPMSIDDGTINVKINMQLKDSSWISMDISSDSHGLKALCGLEAFKYEFSNDTCHERWAFVGTIGLDHGFVCELNKKCDPYFVIADLYTSYILYDFSDYYYFVSSSSVNSAPFRPQKEVIENLINSYL